MIGLGGMIGNGCGARAMIATGIFPNLGIGMSADIQTQFMPNLSNHIFLILNLVEYLKMVFKSIILKMLNFRIYK